MAKGIERLWKFFQKLPKKVFLFLSFLPLWLNRTFTNTHSLLEKKLGVNIWPTIGVINFESCVQLSGTCGTCKKNLARKQNCSLTMKFLKFWKLKVYFKILFKFTSLVNFQTCLSHCVVYFIGREEPARGHWGRFYDWCQSFSVHSSKLSMY